MRDPHVVSLTYRLETGETVSFQNSPLIESKTDAFDARLDGDSLAIRLKDHFPDVNSARDVVDPWLRSWEIHAALEQNGQREIWFEFVGAEFIDRAPFKPGEPAEVHADASGHGHLSLSATLHVNRNRFPEPPSQFTANDDVRVLWSRFQAHKAGKEPLLSMAYFCLDRVEKRLDDGRRGAARTLNIDFIVLDKLGELASKRGDDQTARKGGTVTPLTMREQQWLNAALLGLIKQFGAYHATLGTPRHRLTMADLPALPH